MCLPKKYVSTGEHKKESLKVIAVKQPTHIVFDKIVDYLQENEYEDIKSNKEFLDIYCYDFGYEISIQVLSDEKNTYSYISVSMYKDHRSFMMTHHLKQFISTLKEEFNK